VIYDWGRDGVPDHCGIIETVGGSSVVAIEAILRLAMTATAARSCAERAPCRRLSGLCALYMRR
jgi:hypothetical protein